ncbi:hypothetical protein CMQ_5760 [Grosmannia clavigera kw1407]|uniref:Uncharacterized protein n=1 Tax=Grosmannia clavigera (strain kw1407 / UAMH 11150) TaxID=655863 RepID=F0XT01_GROCL|nr:uncharacterized protein CMQ_5760 [Grosmannia clavigera kw1407]EFW99339.1 hypothetical protein CMQ_5760 [Grosmannia clavigera kw1407]
MVRKLPWDRRQERSRNSVPRHSSSSRPAPMAHDDDSPQARVREPSVSRDSRASAVARKFRSPSTSPPPAPPSETFMIAGMDHDDQYRMVEDELLSVAHEFTAHLHAAEYHRLKTTAKSLGAEAIRNISRPVTDGPTPSVRRQQEADRRAEKLQRGLQWAFGSGGGEDEDADVHEDAPWKGTALQNIMEGTGRKVALVPLLAASSRRPVEAKRLDVETEDDEDDEDDLDGPSILKESALRRGQVAAVDTMDRLAFSFDSATSTTANESRPDAGRDNRDTDSSDASDSLDMSGLLQKIRQRRQREKAQRQQQNQQRWRPGQERNTDMASAAVKKETEDVDLFSCKG